MTAVTLTRCDEERNLHRHDRLDGQPDLFEAWCFIREWGCVGRTGGRSRSVAYATSAEARAALDKHRRAKMRRGYA